MNQSRWTSIASFAAIMAAGITALCACAASTDSTATDSTKTALSSTDTTTDADASTTEATNDRRRQLVRWEEQKRLAIKVSYRLMLTSCRSVTGCCRG